MPRISHLAGAVVLALGCAATAQAQTFSGVVTFGDSLSDAGNIAAVSGLPPGNSFTTNPDPVFAQVVAGHFGFNQTNSLAGGSNFAWGGACIQAAGPCVNPNPATRIPNQITDYLAAHGGRADSNALYTLWGGANDINAALGGGVWTTQAQIEAGAQAVGIAVVGQAARLQAAGVNYLVVFNLPDIGRTPALTAAGPTAATAATLAVLNYNGALNAGLATLRDGIIPVNTFALVNEVLANPGAFGFTNVTGTACTPPNSVACGPAGSGLPATYAPGTNQTWFFADGIHPTGAAHALLAEVVLSTVAAPQQMAMLAETPLQVYDAHAGSVRRELLAARSGDRADGTMVGFANLNYADQSFEAGANNPALDSKLGTLTLGVDYRIDDTWTLGAAASFATQDADHSRGGFDAREALFSAFGTFNFGGGGYLQAILSGGSTSYETERAIDLRATTRIEKGDVGGSHTAAELGFGWLFGTSLQHGPFVSATWQSVDVDAFRETGSTSTGMRFDDFERESLVTQAGYQLFGSIGTGTKWQPYLRVAYAQEDENDPTRVRAGSNTMNGQFVMPGYAGSDDWVSADLGLGMQFNEKLQGYVGYHGQFGDDQFDSDSLNLGLRYSF